MWSFRLAFDVGRLLSLFIFFFPQYDHFPTDSWQLFNYCTVARFCGSVVYPGRQDLHRQRYQHQRRERKKEPTNYSLIIKNACAHRINPNASIALPSAPLMLLIAYQCSISIANWIGIGLEKQQEMEQQQEQEQNRIQILMIPTAVHQGVIDIAGGGYIIWATPAARRLIVVATNAN